MPEFEDLDQFSEWFRQLNPFEELDVEEAMEVYFNLEFYGEYV